MRPLGSLRASERFINVLLRPRVNLMKQQPIRSISEMFDLVFEFSRFYDAEALTKNYFDKQKALKNLMEMKKLQLNAIDGKIFLQRNFFMTEFSPKQSSLIKYSLLHDMNNSCWNFEVLLKLN